jgi:hypothetical protein
MENGDFVPGYYQNSMKSAHDHDYFGRHYFHARNRKLPEVVDAVHHYGTLMAVI